MIKLLYPLIAAYRIVFLALLNLCGSAGCALVLLSLITSIMMILLGKLLSRYPKRETQVQLLMAEQLSSIKANYNGEQRQQHIASLYKRFGYHPILSLRSAFPLFIQLPFLLAAYHAINSLPALQGHGLGLIANLQQPDSLLWGINLLPLLMTAINLVSTMLNPVFSGKERWQAVFIALLFLILLYKAASALLVYWTCNNLIFLLRTIMDRKNSRPPNSESQFSYATFKKLCHNTFSTEKLSLYLTAASLLFFLLVISYLLQFLADAEGRFLTRVSKTIPLFLAAWAFWQSSVLYLNVKQFWSRMMFASGLLIPIFILALHLFNLFPISSRNYIIFPFLALFYVSIPIFLLILNRPASQLFSINSETTTIKPLVQNLVFFVVIPLLPALHLASVNPAYLSGWFYPLFFIVPILLCLVVYLLVQLLFGNIFPYLFLKSVSSFFVFVYLSMPVIRAAMQRSSSHDADFWLLFGAIFVLMLWLSLAMAGKNERNNKSILKIFARSAILLLIVSLGNLFWGKGTGKTTPTRKLANIPAELSQQTLKQSPNIYLFVYDGIPNRRVFEQQNLPFDRLNNLLQHYGYKLYEDTYTLGSESLSSMAMLMNITAEVFSSQTQMQDIYSGNSIANLFLRQHGYSTFKLLDNYYTGTSAIANQEIVTQFFPPKELSTVKTDFFVTLLRGMLQGELKFDTKGILAKDCHMESDRQNFKHNLIETANRKCFVLDHYSLPSHSQNSGKCLPNETELWIERFNKALNQMESDLAAIEKHDPNSISILIGDHGPALSGDCYVLQNWKREEISAELIWDRIGTMLAIRWNDPDKATTYDADLTLNQDIFAVLFAYLCEDKNILKLKPDRTFTGYGLITRPPISFRKGQMIY